MPVEDSVDTLKNILKDHEIIIITSRPISWKEKTEKWIGKHLSKINAKGIYSGDFHSQGKTKAEICEELKIVLMIEDNKNYALECAKRGIQVILFDKPWNVGINHENIKRINSWTEAIKIINILNSQV